MKNEKHQKPDLIWSKSTETLRSHMDLKICYIHMGLFPIVSPAASVD